MAFFWDTIMIHNADAYLLNLDRMGIRLGLDRIRGLLERLGHPQKHYETLLVGGTNGKGSISAMTASVLLEAGYRVGLYTSPHLVDYRERLRVNGEMISEEKARALIEEIRSVVTDPVTFFEFLTAMALLHFQREGVQIAVLEVGMGGRLDATNVTDATISVVSNIALDHQSYLGRTLSAIAWEKAGIVGQGGVCLTAARQPIVLETLALACKERGATLLRLGRDIRIRRNRDGTIAYKGLQKKFDHLTLSLSGRHQERNAALSLGAVECLQSRGFDVDNASITAGVYKTQWAGRLEVLQQRPIVLLDGAHNVAGVETLRQALKTLFRYERLILIFGVLADKDYAAMIKKLLPLTDKVILTRPANERAVSPHSVATVVHNLGHSSAEVIDDLAGAVRRALAAATVHDLVCIAGSLYLVGDIKKLWPQINGAS